MYNSVVQQLLQTPLVVLIDIYFEVMRTLVALVLTVWVRLIFGSVRCCSISYAGNFKTRHLFLIFHSKYFSVSDRVKSLG